MDAIKYIYQIKFVNAGFPSCSLEINEIYDKILNGSGDEALEVSC